MVSLLRKIHTFFAKDLWDIDIRAIGKPKAFFVRLLQLLSVIVRELSGEQITLRAMGLVYTSLLSIVPLLAVSFSVLKAFGVHARLEILLYQFLEPLGPKGVDVSMKIIEFVERINVTVLGSIGLATLIFTVISQIQKIESALNYLWNVKTARSLAMRFSNYMSVLLIGPVLIFSALGLATSLMSTSFVHMLLSIEPFGTVIYLATKLIPFALVCAAFTFFYSSLPNTKVHLISALVGGVFAGLLWMTTGMVFTSFVVSSAQYSAVYSGFAVLILFLIWLYWSFLILLIGARVSFYHQYPQFIAVGSKRLDLSDRLKERLALFIMFLIGHSFYHSTRPWQFSSLTDRLGLPADAVHDVLRVLQGKRLIIPSGDEPPAYYPARDIEIIRVKEVIDAIRMAGEDSGTVESEFPVVPEIDAILRKVDEAVAGSLNSETIKDLVLSHKENV